jgi:hypothetical protein
LDTSPLPKPCFLRRDVATGPSACPTVPPRFYIGLLWVMGVVARQVPWRCQETFRVRARRVVADVAERRLRRARPHARSMCRKTHAHLQRARLAVRGLTANEGDVDPVVAFGCRVDELSEPRPYPWRQGGRLDASPARYTARHGGRRDWVTRPAHAPPRDGQSRRYALAAWATSNVTPAMPAGLEAPTLDHRHLVRHSGMRRIVGDHVDAGLRHDLAGLVFLRHVMLRIKLINDF